MLRCGWFQKASWLSSCLRPSQRPFTGIAAVTASKSPSTPPLTSAQLSRAVWQSVRMAFQARDVQTAYILAESARLSNKPLLHNSPSKHYLSTGIEFHQPVSQRLSGHALIHGLLRLGLARKAHSAAKILMDNGIPIRTRTLETLLEALVISDGNIPRSYGQEFIHFFKTLLPKPNILSLHPSLTRGRGNRAAMDLFACARNSKRQKRTERMYKTLISSCLLHGELIAATLLFAAILKDCAVRDAIARQLVSPELKEDPELEQQTVEHYRYIRRIAPYPSFDILKEIISSMSHILSKEPAEDDAYRIPFRAALQALANLAYMLDIRQIPYSHLSSLLRLLYSCPKTDDMVWIMGKDHKPVQTKAYDYFHIVLYRFIQDLPRGRLKEVEASPKAKGLLKPPHELLRWDPSLTNSRPLDLPACNSLLHYAFRHRLSPQLADAILQYMQDPFWKKSDFRRPVPNEVTYNVILTAGRILRSPVLAETALRMFKHDNDNGEGGMPMSSSSLPARNLDSTQGLSIGRFSRSLQTLVSQSHQLSIPTNTLSLSKRKKFSSDPYTLSSYISYLVSTGQPHVVPDLLFKLLPELSIIDHPEWGNLLSEEIQRLNLSLSKEAKEARRTECLTRLVSYGPHFFVNVLNAVVKAGRTGLAERVWHLAKEAERASWDLTFNNQGRIAPWCLPIHAYTLMLVCYGDEARRRRRVYRNPTTTSAVVEWQPQSKRYVVGWAHYILRQNAKGKSKFGQPPLLLRSITGRDSAVSLYQSMLGGARSVYQELYALIQNYSSQRDLDFKLQLPIPDARFFNAMLRIVTRRPSSSSDTPRRARTSPSHWRQHIRFADWMYRTHGRSLSETDGDLVKVVEDMSRAGFDIPVGVGYLLVGQGRGGSVGSGKKTKKTKMSRGPWAYPVGKPEDNPFSLHVEKTKGLPLGKLPHRRRRRMCRKEK